MNCQKTVLICDSSADNSVLLADAFKADGRFAVLIPVRNGMDAIDKIRNLTPDILIIDISVSHPDAFQVLEEAERMHTRRNIKLPHIIMTAAYVDSRMMSRIRMTSCELFLQKPFSEQTLIEFVCKLTRKKSDTEKKRERTRAAILAILDECGIPKKLTGYLYTADAALHVAMNPSEHMTAQELYIIIAKEHGTAIQNIERNIRTAIGKCRNNAVKPTNLAFVYYVASRAIIDRESVDDR